MTDQSATPIAAQIQNLLLDARLARKLTTIDWEQHEGDGAV
ncbi:hypothetical protein [Streptomyces klenkii]